MYDKKYYEMAVEAKDVYIKVASEMGECCVTAFLNDFDKHVDAFAGNSITRRAMLFATLPDEYYEDDEWWNHMKSIPSTREILSRFKRIRRKLSDGKLKIRRIYEDQASGKILATTNIPIIHGHLIFTRCPLVE